jgi:hypothetical protein
MGLFDKLFGKDKKKDLRMADKFKKCAICGCTVLDLGDPQQFLTWRQKGSLGLSEMHIRAPRLICEDCGAVICTFCGIDERSCPKCGSKMGVISRI